MRKLRLDAELVRRGLVGTRREAQELIAAGKVLVSGVTATKAARMVDPAEPIELAGPGRRYVSRGGEKLAAALDAFSIDVTHKRCLDVGSSTGGFVDCLLQRGAAQVVAVDVGRAQLDWRLRQDERVDVRERTDVRELRAAEVGTVDLVTVDVSFISLRSVLPSVLAVAGGAPVLALVKPQFEVGKGRVGKKGVVRDEGLQAEAVRAVVDKAEELGRRCAGTVPSPITGMEGNREFFVLLEGPGP